MRNSYRWDSHDKKDENEDKNNHNARHKARLGRSQERGEYDLDEGHESNGNGKL